MTERDENRKMEISKHIGNNIFKFRKKRKYSRETLAEKSNLSSNHIYELEMGNYIPSTLTLIDICIALEVSLSQVVDLPLLNDNNEYSKVFLNDFVRLTEKEQNTIIAMIKYMVNN
ncbi:MAG: helix-turn-helix transcriptional regulator [Clostridia bacterium]|jgi:transcriptional regulator with XRE-family HTH domain|nr:helix-turn-helix transcriptional regulator [Clostridia bacterium]